MSFENVRVVSLAVLAASADIAQGSLVTFSATNGLALPDAVGDSEDIIGVIAEAYDDSEADLGNDTNVKPVHMLMGSGKLECLAGGAIAVGEKIIAGNDGRAIASTTSAGGTVPAGNYREIGIALTAASGAGETITFVPVMGPIVTTA